MIQRIFALLTLAAALTVFGVCDAKAEDAYGRQFGNGYSGQDWNRLYHYPYVYYPQNYYGPDYYKSADDMYYRYPQEMRIPTYNKSWVNFYPEHRNDQKGPSSFFPFCNNQRHTGARYHQGNHFILDVF